MSFSMRSFLFLLGLDAEMCEFGASMERSMILTGFDAEARDFERLRCGYL